MIYFVSRHPGAVDWIKQQAEWKIDCFVPHLDTAVLRAGDVVLGTLPLYLAAEVCEAGIEFYFLQLPQQEDKRGSEYSAAEMDLMGCRLRRFVVKAV